jgi:selenocysteine lyase/cysteine desulfurase
VIGAVALHSAIEQLETIGWSRLQEHDRLLSARLRRGLAAIEGVTLLGPDPDVQTLPLAAFTVEGCPHALVAARLSAEHGIGLRHGCFCAHPYLIRLLGLSAEEIALYRRAVSVGDRRHIPGAVRASAGISTTVDDIDRLLAAVAQIAAGEPAPVPYLQDVATGDYWPEERAQWSAPGRALGASCARG